MQQLEQKKPFARRDIAVAAASVGAGLAFCLLLWARRGSEVAGQYLAGYLVELSLSVDNVFVFALVFERFAVPAHKQGPLLLLGVAGAVVMRVSLLLAGLGAIARFAWLMPVFGILLLAAGVRMARSRHERAQSVPGSGVVGGLLRHAPAGLAAVLLLETADLVFALDSLPAVLAVTRDPVAAVASNLFAILGLRSLYFVVTGLLARLRHMGTAVALVLVFVGLKMIASPWYEMGTAASLAVVIAILLAAALASLRAPR